MQILPYLPLCTNFLSFPDLSCPFLYFTALPFPNLWWMGGWNYNFRCIQKTKMGRHTSRRTYILFYYYTRLSRYYICIYWDNICHMNVIWLLCHSHMCTEELVSKLLLVSVNISAVLYTNVNGIVPPNNPDLGWMDCLKGIIGSIRFFQGGGYIQ